MRADVAEARVLARREGFGLGLDTAEALLRQPVPFTGPQPTLRQRLTYVFLIFVNPNLLAASIIVSANADMVRRIEEVRAETKKEIDRITLAGGGRVE